MRTTSAGQPPAYHYHRPSWRRPLIVLTVIVVLLAVAGYAAYTAYQRFVVQVLTVPGAMYAPHRAIAPGTTRTPSRRVFSGTRSW